MFPLSYNVMATEALGIIITSLVNQKNSLPDQEYLTP